MPHCGGLKNLSGTVGETTLAEAQMPAHDHAPQGATSYLLRDGSGIVLQGGGSGTRVNYGGAFTVNGGSQPHTHSLSGASGEASGMPPFYSLAYIMRTA